MTEAPHFPTTGCKLFLGSPHPSRAVVTLGVLPKGHTGPSALWRGRSQPKSRARVPRITKVKRKLHPWATRWSSLLYHT